jgi:hypothetical protein
MKRTRAVTKRTYNRFVFPTHMTRSRAIYHRRRRILHFARRDALGKQRRHGFRAIRLADRKLYHDERPRRFWSSRESLMWFD